MSSPDTYSTPEPPAATEPVKKSRDIAVPLFSLAAVLGIALSSNTSWRYFGDHLHVTNIVERAGMFAVLEVVLLACAMGARSNLHNPDKGRPGAPGYAVWLFAAFAAFPAYSVGGADLVAGTVRAVLGPVVAVFSFHMALGLELRHRKPDSKSKSFQAVIGREIAQRIYARFGLATRDRSALEISQARAVVKASVLSGRISALPARRRTGRAGRRLAERLQKELRRSGVAQNPSQADALLAQLSIARHAVALSDLTLVSPWSDRPAVVPAQRTEVKPEPAGADPEPEPRPEPEPEPATSDSDLLIGAQPPAWSSMSAQAAIERIDAILPGPQRPPAELVKLLAGVGVATTDQYVRTCRSRASSRRRPGGQPAAEQEQDQDSNVYQFEAPHQEQAASA